MSKTPSLLSTLSPDLFAEIRRIHENPEATTVEHALAKKTEETVSRLYNRIIEEKMGEVIARLRTSTSLIDRKYAVINQAVLGDVRTSAEAVQQLFTGLKKSIETQIMCYLQSTPSQQAVSLAKEKMGECGALLETSLLNASQEHPFYSDFLEVHNKAIQKFSLFQVQVTDVAKFLHQQVVTSTQVDPITAFKRATLKLLNDLSSFILAIKDELTLRRTLQLLSLEPIKQHTVFLDELIHDTIFSSTIPQEKMTLWKETIENLKKEEPEFEQKYDVLGGLLNTAPFDRNAIAHHAYLLKKDIDEKMKKVLHFCHEVITQSLSQTQESLSKRISRSQCSNPRCPITEHQQSLPPSARMIIPLKKCSRCMSAVYCSPECQRMDWPEHKKVCVKK